LWLFFQLQQGENHRPTTKLRKSAFSFPIHPASAEIGRLKRFHIQPIGF